MYYHVLIETNEKVGKSKSNRKYFELDKTNLLEIEENIVIPFLNKMEFQFDGFFIKSSDIVRFVIKQSEKTTKDYSKNANEKLSNVVMSVSPKDTFKSEYMQDIAKQVFDNAKEKIAKGE